MSRLTSDRRRAAKHSGLQRLDQVRPHVHGTDWRKKPERTAWRFGWNLPLFGGRLPSPSFLAARLAEIYSFFAPPLLLLAATAIAVLHIRGSAIPVWLLATTPLMLAELYRQRRRIGSALLSVKDTFLCIGALIRAVFYLVIMLMTWRRMK